MFGVERLTEWIVDNQHLDASLLHDLCPCL